MSNMTFVPSRKTPDYMPSVYCNKPAKRAYEIEGMVSVKLKDLFPSMPDSIYNDENDDAKQFVTLTEKALEHVDMSGITPDTSVNICCAEHGFIIYGGLPYLEMLKTIKRVVFERTGCRDIRLRVVMYRTPRECEEVIEYYNLREEFDNNVAGVCAYDKGVPIQTKLGTFYGVEKAYDADKFIYAYYDDVREVYAHSVYRKAFKAFMMNMARFETRSVAHLGWDAGNNCGAAVMAIPTAIFDSDFVQSKYTFSCFLRSTPNGLTGVEANNDLYAIDDNICRQTLRTYPLVYQLFQNLENFTAIVDGGRWPAYMTAGGVISGVTTHSTHDAMDLDARPERPNGMLPGMKAGIINQAWTGINYPYAKTTPHFLVGQDIATRWKYDPCSKFCVGMPLVTVTDTLEEAMDKSREIMGANRFLIFDGSTAFINCSPEVAESLCEMAPAVEARVLNELYPKYMKQRGLEP